MSAHEPCVPPDPPPDPPFPERGTDALAHLPGLSPELRPLIEGAGGSSPYLGSLIAREAAWLADALETAPEDVVDALIAEAATLLPANLDTGLRRIKRRAALMVALADLGGVWPLATVTQYWTGCGRRLPACGAHHACGP